MWKIVVLLLLLPLVSAHGDEGHHEPVWQSGTLALGDTFSQTFDEVRPHGYTDAYTGRNGQINVVEGGPMSVAVDINEAGFSPMMIDLGPGGTVTWTVTIDSEHAVTSLETRDIAVEEESPLGLLPAIAAIAAVVVLRRRAA